MDNILGCFVSGPSTYYDSSPADIEVASQCGEIFNTFIWGTDGLSERIKSLKHKDYGKDLILILYQFYLNPIPVELQHLKDIERYRKSEKSIGIPIIVDESNFFSKTDNEKVSFLKSSMLEKLNLLDAVVKRNKLDTDLKQLKVDLLDCLKK
ncbi:MAG: hypothetical protein RLO81_12750 [Fulvivirga sp.]|uniref:hypothetical protein n=1 Tax=Fulvivirga sp. TaxID=1931237 RepID=UPI0032EC8E03